jgi:multimeric flavodoxin WrbA
MKFTILNGNPVTSAFDDYLRQLKGILESGGDQVTLLYLRDLNLHYCIGCFGCWVKTPGQCIARDASLAIDQSVISSDFTLWAAPLKMGFPSALLKAAIDKHLPLIHPYMVVDHNEAHHRKRYTHYPRLGLLLEIEATTDERDLQIVTDIFCRTALNFKTRLEFSLTTQTPVAELARRMSNSTRNPIALPQRLPATRGFAISPPNRLTLFNGSPRGRRGNTPIMLTQIAQGFAGPTDTYHLVRLKEIDQMVHTFSDAECVILGFPLYTDAMPGVVKHFIEALEPLADGRHNPPLGFLVQSGFPEGLHSRYVERYLEKLATNLGSIYLGTIVRGRGERTRDMTSEVNLPLFTNLRTLGANLATEGRFDPTILEAIARPERFPIFMWPVFQILLRLPMGHGYFDDMLNQNGTFPQRFAQPFIPERGQPSS